MGYEQKPAPQRSGAGAAIVMIAAAMVALLCAAGVVVAGFWLIGVDRIEARRDVVTIAESAPAGGGAAPNDEVGRRFEARLKAAQMMFDPNQRDEAYVQIAQDAAKQGQGQTSLRVLTLVSDPRRREATAFAVARGLSQAQQEEQALEAAQLIVDPRKRDEALRSIAKGEWPPEPSNLSHETAEAEPPAP
jgi:hypothetical protein